MTEELRKTKRIGSKIIGSRNLLPEFESGELINSRYMIVENIGSGGFGSVFRATDIFLNKDVALKFLDPEIKDDLKKFIRVKREINISQKITDERIVKIFGIEYMDDIPFIVMEFIEGDNLKTVLNDGRFSNWKEFKSVFIEILKGIKSLHDKNIIHRDIKPSNIIITSESNIKIIDFGLSKELGDTEKTSSIGEMIGSPKYMSPEQIRGVTLDRASDIYQLGLILFYILNPGTEEDGDSSTIERLMERVNSDPRKVYKFQREIPKYLKFGIFKSLESEKNLRFRSVDEMIDYFNAEKVSALTLISNLFKREKKVVFSLITMVVFFGLILFLYFKGSRVMSEINISGSKIAVSNGFGVNLFKKDFAPMKVRNTLPLKINSDFNRLRQRMKKDSYLKKDLQIAAVFLSKDNLYKEIVNLPIQSEKFSSKVSFFDSYGNKIYTHPFHLKNDFLKRSLFSGWMDFTDINSEDLDGDGRNEIHFFVYQNMSMFPSGFCIIDEQDFHVVYNSGHIGRFFYYKGDNGENRVLLTGMSNLFSHFRFICDFDIDKTTNLQLPPFLSANLNRSTPRFYYMLIPFRAEIISNKWNEGGSIVFKSHSSNTVYELKKNWDMSITEEGKVSVYKDDNQNISDMLYFLSLAYQKKIMRNSFSDPVSEIQEALKLNISNPVFKSLMYYYAGDLYLNSGNYTEAEKHFLISKKIFPENDDIDQKLAELYFLSGKRDKLWDDLGKRSVGFSRFFGLGDFGIKLFKTYIFLHEGEFRAASDLSGSYKKAENYLKGMISLYKGDYRRSLSESSLLIGDRTTPFTLSEARLLYSRAVLLNYIFNSSDDLLDNKDVKLADFYFSDIAVNSLLDGHLAAMSRAYFMAVNGDNLNAEEYADEILTKLLRDSRGDMFTKLWLFYDSFIYGKLMEKTGNTDKAIKGYKICIKSNPYTELAKRSKENVDRLEKKQISEPVN